MDVGLLVNWVQLGLWVIAILIFVGRLLKGKAHMPKWFSSNLLFGGIIIIGVVCTGISLYLNYRVFRPGSIEGITVSAYEPDATTLTVISNKTFENTDVPLDGYSFNNVTFINCCLLYDGGSYQLQNVTVQDHWRVCVKDQRLQNYAALVRALGLSSVSSKSTSKTVIISKPQPTPSTQP